MNDPSMLNNRSTSHLVARSRLKLLGFAVSHEDFVAFPGESHQAIWWGTLHLFCASGAMLRAASA